MEHFYQNLEGENWFDYEDVYRDAVIRGKNGDVFVELGSWRGKSSVFMAVEIINSKKDIKFYCVDNWSQGDTREDFLNNTMLVNDYIFLIDMLSWDASERFQDRSVDFCFIDAAHDYKSKRKDIEAWLPKMKPGGIISGHDYTPNMDGYNRTYDAVNDVLGKQNIKTIKNVWLYEVP